MPVNAWLTLQAAPLQLPYNHSTFPAGGDFWVAGGYGNNRHTPSPAQPGRVWLVPHAPVI